MGSPQRRSCLWARRSSACGPSSGSCRRAEQPLGPVAARDRLLSGVEGRAVLLRDRHWGRACPSHPAGTTKDVIPQLFARSRARVEVSALCSWQCRLLGTCTGELAGAKCIQRQTACTLCCHLASSHYTGLKATGYRNCQGAAFPHQRGGVAHLNAKCGPSALCLFSPPSLAEHARRATLRGGRAGQAR